MSGKYDEQKKTITDKSYSLVKLAPARLFKLPKHAIPAPHFSKKAAGTESLLSEYIKTRRELDAAAPLSNPPQKIIDSHLLHHLFDFLDHRPLSSTWEADEQICGNGNVFRNVQTEWAQTALDMIHHEHPTLTADKPGWVRFAFLPNQWFDKALSYTTNTHWKRSFHTSSVQCLYSVLYHGGIPPNCHRFGCGLTLENLSGIHSYDNFEIAASDAILSQIQIPGVWYQVIFEIARRGGISFQGADKNQCVSAPVNVSLLAVWIKIKKTSQLNGDDLMFVPPSGLWSEGHESNPLDIQLPIIFRIQQNDVDLLSLDYVGEALTQLSDNNLIVDKHGNYAEDVAKFARLNSDGTVHQLTEASIEQFLSFSYELITDIETNPTVRVDWETYAGDVLVLIEQIATKTIASAIKTAMSAGRWAQKYVFLLTLIMFLIGDVEKAVWLELLYRQGKLPPSFDWSGSYWIGSDSLFNLKRVHTNSEETKSAKPKHTRADSFVREQLQVISSCLTIKWESSAGIERIAELLLNHSRNNSSACQSQPRVLLIYYMMNDFVDKNWRATSFNKDQPIWNTLRCVFQSLKRHFDRIMVVGGGSSEFWGLNSQFDKAKYFMTNILTSMGIVAVDGLSLLESCSKCSDGFHLDGSDVPNQ